MSSSCPRLVGHRAAPQHVVVDREPARSQQPDDPLVVVGVLRLAGVDEREVERALGAVREQRVERLERRREPEVDAVGDAGLGPVAPRDRRPLLGDVAAHDRAVRRHRQCHDQRGVAGERPDLEAALRAGQLDEQRQQRALLRGDLHVVLRDERRLLAEAGEDLRLADAVLDEVLPRGRPGGPSTRSPWPPRYPTGGGGQRAPAAPAVAVADGLRLDDLAARAAGPDRRHDVRDPPAQEVHPATQAVAGDPEHALKAGDAEGEDPAQRHRAEREREQRGHEHDAARASGRTAAGIRARARSCRGGRPSRSGARSRRRSSTSARTPR